jgi:hypothetical protein
MTMLMENQAGPRTHNGLGIASFVIGVGSVVAVVALIAVATVWQIKTGKLTPELNMIVGLGMLSVAFVDLIGLGLGVSGAVDRASTKTFPALGLTLNIAMLVLFAACVAAGLSMKGH